MKSNIRQLLLVSLIILASMLLFLKDLKLISPTYDENFSYIRNSIYLVQNLKWDQEYLNLHPPLMYFSHGWPFFFIENINYQEAVFITRIAILPMFFFFAVIFFFYTKKFANEFAAYFSLILLSFNTEILAHSRLVTADYLLAITVFLSIAAFFHFLKSQTKSKLVLAGVTLGLALISKYTALLLLPIYFALVSYLLAKKRLEVKKSFQFIPVLAIALLIIHASYLFKESIKIPQDYQSSYLLAIYKNKLTKNILFVFPRTYLSGVDLQLSMSKSMWWGYFNGKPYYDGLWYFYPASFLLKTSIPLMLFLAVSVYFSLRQKLKSDLDKLLLFSIILFFAYFSLLNNLIIGLRYLLMVYPLMFLYVSKLIRPSLFLKKPYLHLSIIILVGYYIFQTIKISPHYLAFANEFAGGPKNAYKYFADSNLDWNQNEILFERYLKSNPQIAAVNPKWPTSGKIAVSVNEYNLFNYQNMLWLRNLKKEPVENIGFTWLIFEVYPQELGY